MVKKLGLLASHAAIALIGFMVGIYALPILIAPPPPDAAVLQAAATGAQFKGQFRRDLKDSDALHWGEGEVFLDSKTISLRGRLAPGPDYKLYLSPQFIETEADFARLKSTMLRVGDIKTFEGFSVPLANGIDLSQFNTVIVWCESFGQFISAAQYR